MICVRLDSVTKETLHTDHPFAHICDKHKINVFDLPQDVDTVIDKICVLHGYKKIALPKAKMQELENSKIFETIPKSACFTYREKVSKSLDVRLANKNELGFGRVFLGAFRRAPKNTRGQIRCPL